MNFSPAIFSRNRLIMKTPPRINTPASSPESGEEGEEGGVVEGVVEGVVVK